MKNAVILHGAGADSQSNWFPWIKERLEEEGYKVWVPDLPNSMNPNATVNAKYVLDNWQFDEDSLIIGHSSGAVLVLFLLQNLPENIVVDKAFLVSVFKDDLGWPNLKNLFSEPFDWAKIKKNAQKITLLHSDNDPYIPLDHAEFVAMKLNAELIVKENQGHFLCAQFPTLLKIIEECTQENNGRHSVG